MTRFTYLTIGLHLALIAFFSPKSSTAQCTVLPNAVVEGTILPTTGGTDFRSAVVFNPNQNLYYSTNGGSSGYPIETYDINGVSLSSPASGFDYRGTWWNPVTNQLEGNGYNSGGIVFQNLNATTGYAENGTNSIFPGAQPDFHSSGTLDTSRYEIVYYFNNQIFRYDRTNNSLVATLNVTGLPAGVGTLNANQVIATGCAGLDYAIYDNTNKALLFLDATGAYVTSSQLPASAPTNSTGLDRDQVSFANGLLWLYNGPSTQWEAYEVLESCPAITSSFTSSICAGDTFELGTQRLTATGIYTETFMASDGCDSVVTLDLTVNPTFEDQVSAIVCAGDDYLFPDGTVETNIQGPVSQLSMFTTATGCDSSILTSITVSPSYSITVQDTICVGESYMFPDGSMLVEATVSLIDTSTFQTTTGTAVCDSLVITDLTVNTVDASLTSNVGQLIAANPNASYQWLRCDSAYAPIAGETGQVFTPLVSGDYGVEVTDPVTGCVDTSDCFTVTLSTGIFAANRLSMKLSPNPTASWVTVEWTQTQPTAQVRLLDARGKLLQQRTVHGAAQTNLDLSDLPQGIYSVQVISTQQMGTQMLIKQ